MIGRAFLATFRAILADRSAFMLIVVSTILYSFFYPSAYSGEVAVRIPVAVVDLDNSGASRSLIRRISALQQAELAARLPSPQDAEHWLQTTGAGAVIVIPQGFERNILTGAQGTVALYGNGAYLLRSSTALSGAGLAITVIAAEAAIDQAMMQGAPVGPALSLVPRPLFNTREGYGSTVFPGVGFLIIHQTLLMGLTMLAATLRETLGRFRLPSRTLVGIALAFFVIGWADVAYYAGFVFWFQDYPRGGASPGALIVGGSLFVAATVAAALALASFFRTRERPLQLWMGTSLVIFFLAGLSWPAEATPAWLAILARLLPTTAGIHLMVGLNQMGASLGEQIREVLNLTFLILGYGALAWWRFTRGPVPLLETDSSATVPPSPNPAADQRSK
ncbi:ABC transporter permease [Sandaracinobacter neustonicus]|uniref:ABC transporter permease n=2 Tax=Alphaproteobacteria TaxID=28211 RepID=A0A501XHJ0_9SPHN|nr:ABC transporter permease [Sandaracinobacter neustonicus]TPE59774.1 ABC transporter permease [Sandaracinobacter neustonicus]